MRQSKLVTLLGVLYMALCSSAYAGEYHAMGTISIDGQGGWDFVSVDSVARRLYVTHATKVDVIDLDTNKVIGELTPTPGVHGFAIARELGRGFSSNGKDSSVGVFDLATLKLISKLPAGNNPDTIIYESKLGEVYAFNGKSNTASVFNAKSGKAIATISLSGKPEFAAFDSGLHRVFVNIEDKSLVGVIDSRSHKVIAYWPIAPGVTPSGIAIDTKHHRLFIGCDNQILVVMDSVSGKVIATTPIGKQVDAVAYDPELKLIFSSNGEGNVTIIHEDTPTQFTVQQILATQKRARTMGLDLKTHRIFLPVSEFTPPASTSPTERHGTVIPGTFKVLVYEYSK